MAFSPFQTDLDGAQGRHPTDDAPAGAYVLELGHATLQADYLVAGDYHQVSQVVTIATYIKRIRFQVRIVAPTDLPAGRSWRFTARLNGTALYQREIPEAVRKRDLLVDGCIPLSGANYSPGTDTLAFRLELV